MQIAVQELECEESSMSTATDLATLTERVTNHIKFFWVVVAFGFVWLAAMSGFLWTIHGQLGGVAQAQANAPGQTAEALLARPANSQSDMAEKLGAVSAVLQSARIGPAKADSAIMNRVSSKILDAQIAYPELPQVWQATSALISYKSESETPNQGIRNDAKCTYQIKGNAFVFTDCEVALETIADRLNGNLINGHPVPFFFVNCLIHYSGGFIPAGRLTFANSAFRLSVPVVPSPAGKITLQKLTTAEIDKPIEIKLG